VIPGNLQDPFFVASNRLVVQGTAKMVLCAQDILDEYQTSAPSVQTSLLPKEAPEFESPEEKALYEVLSDGQKDISTLSQHLNLDITEILSIITMLELRGIIRQHESGLYMITE